MAWSAGSNHRTLGLVGQHLFDLLVDLVVRFRYQSSAICYTFARYPGGEYRIIWLDTKERNWIMD